MYIDDKATNTVLLIRTLVLIKSATHGMVRSFGGPFSDGPRIWPPKQFACEMSAQWIAGHAVSEASQTWREKNSILIEVICNEGQQVVYCSGEGKIGQRIWKTARLAYSGRDGMVEANGRGSRWIGRDMPTRNMPRHEHRISATATCSTLIRTATRYHHARRPIAD